jgi:predicted ATPase
LSIGTLRGDVTAVDELTMTLVDHAEKQSLPLFRAFGKAFTAWVLINRGEVEEGWAQLQSAAALAHGESVEVGRANTALVAAIFYGALAEVARRNGPIEEAQRGIANALSWFRQHGGGWCAAELLRLDGELVLVVTPAGAAEIAEKRFKESLSIARRHGTRSWELRTAISLARLWCSQNRVEEAFAMLRESYDMFDEGFDTEDLRTAREMVEILSGSQLA